MKLNLGSGDRRIDGYQSVDLYANNVDVRADIRTVGFPAGTIEEIVAYHVIEHVTREEGIDLLRRAFAWLRPGGRFAIETPDRLKCMELIRQRKRHRDKRGTVRLIGGVGLLGGRPLNNSLQQEYHTWIADHADEILEYAAEFHHFPPELIPAHYQSPGATHVHVWAEAELRAEMEQIGYAVVSGRPQTHGNRDWRDMRLVGVKPDGNL